MGDWYQLTLHWGNTYKIYYPGQNSRATDITLTSISKPTFAPMHVRSYYADDHIINAAGPFVYYWGSWGVVSMNAHCRFSCFQVIHETTPTDQ